MLKRLKRLFGYKEPGVKKSLEDRLFANILVPREPRDYFKWPYIK